MAKETVSFSSTLNNRTIKRLDLLAIEEGRTRSNMIDFIVNLYYDLKGGNVEIEFPMGRRTPPKITQLEN